MHCIVREVTVLPKPCITCKMQAHVRLLCAVLTKKKKGQNWVMVMLPYMLGHS